MIKESNITRRRGVVGPNVRAAALVLLLAPSMAQAGAMPRFAYFPFGGGPRLCMGEAYGTMVSLVVIAMVSQAFRLDLVPGRTTTPQPLISLVPDQIWVTASRRQPAST